MHCKNRFVVFNKVSLHTFGEIHIDNVWASGKFLRTAHERTCLRTRICSPSHCHHPHTVVRGYTYFHRITSNPCHMSHIFYHWQIVDKNCIPEFTEKVLKYSSISSFAVSFLLASTHKWRDAVASPQYVDNASVMASIYLFLGICHLKTTICR